MSNFEVLGQALPSPDLTHAPVLSGTEDSPYQFRDDAVRAASPSFCGANLTEPLGGDFKTLWEELRHLWITAAAIDLLNDLPLDQYRELASEEDSGELTIAPCGRCYAPDRWVRGGVRCRFCLCESRWDERSYWAEWSAWGWMDEYGFIEQVQRKFVDCATSSARAARKEMTQPA